MEAPVWVHIGPGNIFRDYIALLQQALLERVPAGFIEWLSDEGKVSFPRTMIDKTTPRPADTVAAALARDGIEGMTPTVTAKGTLVAPFVNTEATQYLAIEDRFPNGWPALEAAVSTWPTASA